MNAKSNAWKTAFIVSALVLPWTSGCGGDAQRPEVTGDHRRSSASEFENCPEDTTPAWTLVMTQPSPVPERDDYLDNHQTEVFSRGQKICLVDTPLFLKPGAEEWYDRVFCKEGEAGCEAWQKATMLDWDIDGWFNASEFIRDADTRLSYGPDDYEETKVTVKRSSSEDTGRQFDITVRFKRKVYSALEIGLTPYTRIKHEIKAHMPDDVTYSEVEKDLGKKNYTCSILPNKENVCSQSFELTLQEKKEGAYYDRDQFERAIDVFAGDPLPEAEGVPASPRLIGGLVVKWKNDTSPEFWSWGRIPEVIVVNKE